MTGSIALITGGNRGIGKEVCRQLATIGCTVLLSARSLSKAQEAAADIGLPNVLPVCLDVNSVDSMNRLSQWVEAEFGRIDILINNAAINYDTWQNAVTADLDFVKATLETNLYGAWHMIQTFLPLLHHSKHPRIVNVSSMSGAIGGLDEMAGGTPAYSISKISLNALTKMLADELKATRILINAVCPGWVATDMGGEGGRPVEEGARGLVWAATLPDDGPTGGFFRDTKSITW